MPETLAKLSCGACGKSYAWKPQYAGKTLKCSCGSAIKAPAAAPALAGAPRRPMAAPVAPPPPDLSSADEFERALSGNYDVSEDAAPAPKTGGTRYPGAPTPAAAPPRPSKGTSFAQARPIEYERKEPKKPFNPLSSPIVVTIGALVLGAVFMVILVGVLRTLKPTQNRIHTTSRSVTTFDGLKETKRVIGPDEMLDANGNIVKKPQQPPKDVDFRTVQPAAVGEQETPEQLRARKYRADAERHDAELKKLIETPGKVVDAREWLDEKNVNHQGAQTQTKDVLMKKVDALYDAGAKKVWVTDLSGVGGKYEYCSSFIIEMPEDFEVRKKVLAVRSRINPGTDTIDWSNNYLKFPCIANMDMYR